LWLGKVILFLIFWLSPTLKLDEAKPYFFILLLLKEEACCLSPPSLKAHRIMATPTDPSLPCQLISRVAGYAAARTGIVAMLARVEAKVTATAQGMMAAGGSPSSPHMTTVT